MKAIPTARLLVGAFLGALITAPHALAHTPSDYGANTWEAGDRDIGYRFDDTVPSPCGSNMRDRWRDSAATWNSVPNADFRFFEQQTPSGGCPDVSLSFGGCYDGVLSGMNMIVFF
jgi:hypothetical protein